MKKSSYKHPCRTFAFALFVVMTLLTSCNRGEKPKVSLPKENIPDETVFSETVKAESVDIIIILSVQEPFGTGPINNGALYYFKLDPQGTLYVANGEYMDFIGGQIPSSLSPPHERHSSYPDLMELGGILEEGSIPLTESQMDRMKTLVGGITRPFVENAGGSDIPLICLIVNGTRYDFTYVTPIDLNLDQIVTELINYSPIKVIDSWGNTIKPSDFSIYELA